MNMKKIVLYALALGIGFTSFAQNQNRNLPVHRNVPFSATHKIVADPTVTSSGLSLNPVKQSAFKVKGPKAGLNQIQIATSGNMLCVEFANYTVLASNPALNLVSFIYRGGGAWSPSTNTSNNIDLKYSADGGTTFPDSLYLGILKSWNNRYPSGVIVNPTGNTTANHAYIGYAGPFWTGSSQWKGHFLGSERLDGDSANSHINYFDWASSYTPLELAPATIASCTDQSVHFFDPYFVTVTTSTNYYTPLDYVEATNGTWVTGTGVDSLHWDTVHFHYNFMKVANDTPGVYMFDWGSAWSEDGSVGYIYCFGVDPVVHYHYSVQPIVWKSTNKGKTWNVEPIFDFSTLSVIHDSIMPAKLDTSVRSPYIGGKPPAASVDNNGNLHIVTTIYGQASLDADSAVYTYTGDVQRLYEIHTKTGGGWGANYIGVIKSADVLSTDPAALIYSGGTNVGWQHRIHITRTADGKKMFATWLDVSNVTSTPSITLPDIIGYGWDNVTGCHTPVKNFTVNTAYDGVCFWKYAADRILTTGSTGAMNYNIPTTVSVPTTVNATDPINHFYMTGIGFTDNDFNFIPVIALNITKDSLTSSLSWGNQWYRNDTLIPGATGQTLAITNHNANYYVKGGSCDVKSTPINPSSGINELSNICNIKIYPNPFHGTTTISVSLTKTSDVSLSVTNVIGQKVCEMNYGTVNAGTHSYIFDGSKLQSGIYFYTVKAGENTDTHKMIIE